MPLLDYYIAQSPFYQPERSEATATMSAFYAGFTRPRPAPAPTPRVAQTCLSDLHWRKVQERAI